MERRPINGHAVQRTIAPRTVKRPTPTPEPRLQSMLPSDNTQFFTSGGYMLDLILGGGWAEDRIINIIGDSSTGKTLLAIEACANFARKYNAQDIRYCEAESAFDEDYAVTMGFPIGVQLTTREEKAIRTVEEWFKDMEDFCAAQLKTNRPGLYILDSLDALTDAAELDREISEATYGGTKAKQMSQIFRRITTTLAEAHVTLIIISQVRDKIGVTFGERHTRSGGKALQFYCSQIIMLHEKSKLKRQIRNAERVFGVRIRVQNKKNKVGVAYRECEQLLIYGYGIDDSMSMIEWLSEVKALGDNKKAWVSAISEAMRGKDRGRLQELNQQLRSQCSELWYAIERDLAPPMSKYGE